MSTETAVTLIDGDISHLVNRLLELAGHNSRFGDLSLTPMEDGGMGSQKIGQDVSTRKYGGVLASVTFIDDDDVRVLVDLIQDQNGQLFEIDVWKVDYSPLSRWPIAARIEEAIVAT